MGKFHYCEGNRLDELSKKSLEEIQSFFVGKKIQFKTPTTADIDDCAEDGTFLSDEMFQYALMPATIRSVKLASGGYCFKIEEDHGCYYWSFIWIEAVINETQPKEEQTQVICKKGDLVRIREDKTERKIIGTYCDIPICENTVYANPKLREKQMVVCDIVDNKILPYYLEDTYYPDIITTDMVEVVTENYMKSLRARKTLNDNEKKILDDINTINEMKSKLDMKTIKKIYAGAMKRIPNEIKGMEQLVHHWACNKKHLYRFLGNELSIHRQIEYKKSPEDVKQDRETLYNMFPGCLYVLKTLRDEEILDNKLHRNYHRNAFDFLRYMRDYKEGDKVSKLLDDAFKNDKLNIEYSNIIANNMIQGTIEISINPIEYMLMSCNKSGWSSCHRLFSVGQSGVDYGQWSAGIFSYMCDEVSLIAFRHDGKLYDYTVNRQKFQAYSKNWRQMIWMSKTLDSFIASRQYPVYKEEISKLVREMLEEQGADDATENQENKWIHTSSDTRLQSKVRDNDTDGHILHYNDILHGYNGDLCYKKDKASEERSIIVVGSNPVCPNCGKGFLLNEAQPECYCCHTVISF